MPQIKREWTPHPKQRAIMNDDSRFRVVAAGRRFGKTELATSEVFEDAFETPGMFVCYFAPTDADAKELGFDPLFDKVPDALIADVKRTPPREIHLTNGSTIQFRGTKSSSRGRGWDKVVIDEKSEVRSDFWDAVVRPSLSDTLGSALFIGTPKGRNKFYELYKRGEDEDRDEWSSWHGTTYDNPHVPDSEVEDARRDIPERVFRQEYLAEFVDDEGAVFGDVRNRNTRPYAYSDVDGTPPFSTGIDLARTNNYLVAVTLDADGMLVGFMRERGASWAAAGRHLAQHLAEYPGVAYIDASRDNKVVEDLARETRGTQVEPVKFTSQNKQDMVENLAARLEMNDVVLPDPELDGNDGVETLLAELDAFEYTTTPAGNVRYGAPEGLHDDTVDALALAAKETERAKATW